MQNKVFFYYRDDAKAAAQLEVSVEEFFERAGQDVEMDTVYFADDPTRGPRELELWFFLPDSSGGG